jgi:hypothetical protein
MPGCKGQVSDHREGIGEEPDTCTNCIGRFVDAVNGRAEDNEDNDEEDDDEDDYKSIDIDVCKFENGKECLFCRLLLDVKKHACVKAVSSACYNFQSLILLGIG